MRGRRKRGRIAKRRDGFRIHVEAVLRLRLQEAFAGLVVARCPQQTGSGRVGMAILLGRASARLDRLAHAGPFRKPSCIVADFVAQRAADPVDLVDLGAAPGRPAETDEQSHRPAIVVGEIQKGRIIGAIGHRSVSRGLSPPPVARRSLIIKTIAYISGLGQKLKNHPEPMLSALMADFARSIRLAGFVPTTDIFQVVEKYERQHFASAG